MPFILRVDVDKPYGHHSISTKILSKLREDYYFPASKYLKYLKPTEEFLRFCNTNGVSSFLYFRNATIPTKKILELMSEGGHILGFHAENTITKETFQEELQIFEEKVGQKVHFFTKHGSGKLKLGKNHYPPYEPEKYQNWSNALGIDFSFGNGIANSIASLAAQDGFYPNMFWIERAYRDSHFSSLEPLIDLAKESLVTLVVHPANFYTDVNVKNDLLELFMRSREHAIHWLNHIPD